jgi:hypothetical protein
MFLNTGLFVCALLASELASLFFVAYWVRRLRNRHRTHTASNYFSSTTPRKIP